MNTKGKYDILEQNIRVYNVNNSIIFKKNNENYGDLSNMSMKYPLNINGVKICNTEALYQACRFPHNIDLQKRIINERSPMKVKMISNANKKFSREDWDDIKLKVMKWCLNLKLAQNFITFGYILDSTRDYNLVENSSKDNFWGAIPNSENSTFIGQNALGRLLMNLREEYRSENKYTLLKVKAPKIEKFLLYDEKISLTDCKDKFLTDLEIYFKNQQLDIFRNKE